MLKLALSGCCGRMGRTVARLAAASADTKIVAGSDIVSETYSDFPVYASLADAPARADAVIDFSNPAAFDGLLTYCLETKTPLVLCTTGLSDAQIAAARDASREIPVFRSANMSLGIALLADLARRAAAVYGEYCDVEIVEKHHNRKLDAPSGTALMLYDALAEALPYDPTPVYDRHERREPRPAHEIGISAVRGGTIVGEHDILFCGTDETVTLSHTALSRDAFAVGALRAARYIAGREPGLYDMRDIMASI
ncbi:MAG: 4-hydroxy-tetrahydrodipicolinate reductase [Eubacteriales bacterium]|nr:4-hydroxy-tetrahydrodipicolinate reductase [Clostridiales bacterium]MDY3072385.1 4-hydroxy-tetrahydrodipicolinate reductase [Eubacteriales bacterium]